MRRAFVLLVAFCACRGAGAPFATTMRADASAEGGLDASARADASADASPRDGGIEAAASVRENIGPFSVELTPKRKVFYVAPRAAGGPQRLLANLHGLCNPPEYACGYWVQSASDFGWLVCPEGNARCGAQAYNAPTWEESFAQMDADLEHAIEAVDKQHPGEISRDGAILTGFSRGAMAAVSIAQAHPGRWPYLILNEADVSLDARALRKAGVRAVALVAGEWGTQIAGERKTAEALKRSGYPAKLWPMPKAGHHYSANIDDIMREAIEFVLSVPEGDGGT